PEETRGSRVCILKLLYIFCFGGQPAQAAAKPGPSARLGSASILTWWWLEPATSRSRGNTSNDKE
ncbi:hypothetical protein K443DRAFT_115519, partial [Laccaria amethystina LaAM-08-1]